MRIIFLLAALALSACGNNQASAWKPQPSQQQESLPVVGERTIAEPIRFIVGARPDGSLLTVHDTLTERRHDWPLPLGYEASDSVLLDDGRALQTFSFAPWLGFNPALGDGGQVLEVGVDGFVRGLFTRDGGKPYVQYFVGGTGWLFFGIDAPTGIWREVVATLSGETSPDAKPTGFGRAFTRYRLEYVTYPFNPGPDRTILSVISEHYDHDSMDASQALERSYFGYGYGLLRWEAWGRTEAAPVPDLAQRYHPVAFSVAPAAGWYLDDIRTFTNIISGSPVPVPVFY